MQINRQKYLFNFHQKYYFYKTYHRKKLKCMHNKEHKNEPRISTKQN